MLPQVVLSTRELRVISEDFQQSGEKLIDVWHRHVIANAYGYDGDKYRRLLQDIDQSLPSLPELRDHFELIGRPATEIEIGDHLAAMRVNFHNSKAAGGYASIMVERAIAKQPSFAAIEWATRECIDTRKFMPVTAEVLEMVASAQARLNSIRDVIATLSTRRADVAKRIAEAEG